MPWVRQRGERHRDVHGMRERELSTLMARCQLADKAGKCRGKASDSTTLVLDAEGEADYLTLEVRTCPRHTVWMRLQTPAVDHDTLT